jgi:hypothetical protein
MEPSHLGCAGATAAPARFSEPRHESDSHFDPRRIPGRPRSALIPCAALTSSLRYFSPSPVAPRRRRHRGRPCPSFPRAKRVPRNSVPCVRRPGGTPTPIWRFLAGAGNIPRKPGRRVPRSWATSITPAKKSRHMADLGGPSPGASIWIASTIASRGPRPVMWRP